MTVVVSWAAFDATGAPLLQSSSQSTSNGQAATVQVAWAEFDNGVGAVAFNVDVSWAAFDIGEPVAPVKKPGYPAFYGYGKSLSEYYDDSSKQFTIPVESDPEDEEETILSILIEIAAYAFI